MDLLNDFGVLLVDKGEDIVIKREHIDNIISRIIKWKGIVPKPNKKIKIKHILLDKVCKNCIGNILCSQYKDLSKDDTCKNFIKYPKNNDMLNIIFDLYKRRWE